MRSGDFERVLVESGITWGANGATQVFPIQGRVMDKFQVYAIEIAVTFTLSNSSGATDFAFADESERNDLVDAFLAGVDVNSTPLGTIIDPSFAVSELVQLWGDHLGAYPVGEIFQLPGTTIPATITGSYTGRVKINVPFTSQAAAIGKNFAPLAGQFQGGGVRVRFGPGGPLSFSSVAWGTSSATIEIALLGREIKAGGAKVAPLTFVRSTDTGSQNEISGRKGLVFGFSLLDTAGAFVPEAIQASGAGGYQLRWDGQEYQSQVGSDVVSDKRWIIDRGPAPGIYRSVVATRPEAAYGLAFYGLPRDGAPALALELTDRIVLQLQSAYGVGQKAYGLIMAPPLDAVGDVKACGCESGTGVTVAPAGTPENIAQKYYPRAMGG